MKRHRHTTTWATRSMWGCILAACVLASMQPAAAQDSRPPRAGGVTVYSNDFGPQADRDGDGWPDGWTRRVDREHPHYLPIKIGFKREHDSQSLQEVRRTLSKFMLAYQQGRMPNEVVPERTPPALDEFLDRTVLDRCLRLTLDGGAIAIECPSFALDRRFTYRIEVDARCADLDDFDARVELVGHDAAGGEQVLAQSSSRRGTTEWRTQSLLYLMSHEDDQLTGKVRIVVQPLSFRALRGTVEIDNVRVRRYPKLSVEIDPPEAIVARGVAAKMQCTVTGLQQSSAQVEVLAYDVDGNLAFSQIKDVRSEELAIDGNSDEPQPYFGRCGFEVSLYESGLYMLQFRLLGIEQPRFEHHEQLMVLGEEPAAAHNPRVGICLPTVGRQWAWADVVRTMRRLQVGCVKLPVWLDSRDVDATAAMDWGMDMLASRRIQVVGVLDRPPESQLKHFRNAETLTIGGYLEQVASWEPLLQPLWQRLCLRVQNFQLGWDGDVHVAENSKLLDVLDNLHSQMALFGPRCGISVPCDVTAGKAHASGGTDRHWQLDATPGLTAAEITAWDESFAEPPSQWMVSIELLNEGRWSLEQRVADLTDKILAVVRSRFAAGSLTPAASRQVVDDAGKPRSMFLPLTHLAAWTYQAEDFQDLLLPDGRRAVLFKSAAVACMLCLPPDNEAAKPLAFSFGEKATAIDVWGRDIPLERSASGSQGTATLGLSRWPVLVRNVDVSLIRWQRAVRLANREMTGAARSFTELTVAIDNPDDVPVIGTIRLIAPEILRLGEVVLPFKAEPLESIVRGEKSELRADIVSASTPVQIEVNIDSPRPLKFVVEETLLVGLPGIQIKSTNAIDDQGRLVVDLRILNANANPVSFDLMLYLPDSPRQRSQMVDIVDRGQKTIIVPNGKAYVGQDLRLSCELIGAGLSINHLIHIE